NGSGDGSVETIRARFPDVALLPIGVNLGFAKAANIGIAHALARGAAGILLLNNDTTVAPDTVRRLAKALVSSERAGVLSAKIFLADQPGRLWKVGGAYRDGNAIDLGSGELDTGQYDQAQLDFVYGCAMLLSAPMLYAIGGFDERFFMYYEDVDLCLRARAAGYDVALAPDAHVWHLGSRSTSAKPALKLYYEARSRLLFYAKHLSGAQRRRFYGSEFRYTISLTLQRLRNGNPRGALAYLRGCLAALAF
ncbi:MAG TPA: glycosyltransferase family 2 protein, partial [Roseiflexaceae bacterium]|nr:glycosyltransferase family 2 protein [Roseiflexaceae bacterium]